MKNLLKSVFRPKSDHKTSPVVRLPNPVTSGFSPGDDDAILAILTKWDDGVLSDTLFTKLVGMLPCSIVEVPIMRLHDNEVETLLLPRPLHDSVWPGMVHTPGTAFRVQDFDKFEKIEFDEPLQSAFERIVTTEIGTPFVKGPEFVSRFYYKSKRGAEVKQVFVATIADDAQLPMGAYWYPVAKLPSHEPFIQEQLGFVKLAEQYFRHHLL